MRKAEPAAAPSTTLRVVPGSGSGAGPLPRDAEEDYSSATIGAARREAARRIGGRTAALDARLLMAQATGVAVERVPLLDGRVMSAEEAAAFAAMVARRIAGEPVARIVGEKEFWGLKFRVTPAVLVPRPDTETLVAAALAVTPRDADISVLDIGTGSGAILIALLSELPRAHGVGTDISPEALAVAAENAARLGVAERCRFVSASWANSLGGTYNLVVANPPYIPTGTIAELDTDVRVFDPALALDGGPDGLDGHRATLVAMGRLLARNGHGFVEIGAGQGPDFQALARRAGFTVRLHRDIAGIERVAEIAR
jgi:release factor glutamine methyltransferase